MTSQPPANTIMPAYHSSISSISSSSKATLCCQYEWDIQCSTVNFNVWGCMFARNSRVDPYPTPLFRMTTSLKTWGLIISSLLNVRLLIIVFIVGWSSCPPIIEVWYGMGLKTGTSYRDGCCWVRCYHRVHRRFFWSRKMNETHYENYNSVGKFCDLKSLRKSQNFLLYHSLFLRKFNVNCTS